MVERDRVPFGGVINRFAQRDLVVEKIDDVVRRRYDRRRRFGVVERNRVFVRALGENVEAAEIISIRSGSTGVIEVVSAFDVAVLRRFERVAPFDPDVDEFPLVEFVVVFSFVVGVRDIKSGVISRVGRRLALVDGVAPACYRVSAACGDCDRESDGGIFGESRR